jgi:hypothetical protein
MLEPEVVCSAELILLVLFLGSSHALSSWHHHPASQILFNRDKIAKLWCKLSVARTIFANTDPDEFASFCWIRIHT